MNCSMCGIKILDEKCAFAEYKKVIDGKEHVFCCSHCADTFEKNR